MSRGLSRRALLGLEAPPRADPGKAALRGGGDDSGDHWIRVHRRAMACRFEVTLSSEHAAFVGAAEEALHEAERVEERFSVFKDTSELHALNSRAAEGPVEVSAEMAALLETAARLYESTGGAFDPTATPLLRAWGFLQREGRRPDEAARQAARERVGFCLVERDLARRTVRYLRPGVELSFGSLGKGHALDLMKARLRAAGVPSALLSAGGSSLLAYGSADGFPVEVTSPRTEGPLFRLRLRDAAQATSGGGRQFFEADGRRYGHVLDPRTGWPTAGVLSATAVVASAAEADALSTALLVSGAALAETYTKENRGVWALLVPEGEAAARQVFGFHPGAQLEGPLGAKG